MRITLSAAITSDGYLDDNTPRRLMISTPEDWAAVLALRADHDAILVGAETLRRDNPALLLRDGKARARRAARGLRPDLTKVTMTRSGRLSPAMRFFTEGDADRLVFSEVPIPALEGVAEVILPGAPLTAAAVVTELEKRGIGSLFVEGGARTLRQFFDAGLADTLRLAVNPALTLGPERGGARLDLHPDTSLPCRRERLNDGMEVAVWRFRADTAARDREDLALAICESRRCVPCDTCYRVGAVIRTTAGELFTGYTHETSPTHHAEQEAIAKALRAGAELRGASICSSMEPCSTRRSEPESCTQLILRHGFAHVAFALYEPDRFACCRGARTLREEGVDVRFYPDLGDEVLKINAHLKH